MSQAFIADASVAIGWVHPAQASRTTAALLEALANGGSVEVPSIWPLEVANALTVLMRRRKVTADERQTALGWLRALPVRLDHDAGGLACSRLADLAVAHQLSVYDAAYLELALRRQLPLACADGPLRKAAVRAGARLWQSTAS